MKIRPRIALLAALALTTTSLALAQRASIKETKGYQKLPDRELSPRELFKKVSPSIVVVSSVDAKHNPIASGSGVVVSFSDPSRNRALTSNGALDTLIATNCHIIKREPVEIKQGEDSGLGVVVAKNAASDLCVVAAKIIDYRNGTMLKGKNGYGLPLKLPAVEIASAQALQVGDQVYAVGTPKGLELTLSNGIVSGFRSYAGTKVIQTTAPISPGSSGGGLFDAKGRLVGITTMYLDGGQNLNFAVPAELIASVPELERGNAQSTAAAPQPRNKAAPLISRDRWRIVENNEGGIQYLDTQTIQRNGPNRTVSIRYEFKSALQTPQGSVDQMLTRQAHICPPSEYQGQHALLEATQYFRGKVVSTREYQVAEMQWIGTQPGSSGEVVHHLVCAL